MKAHRNDERRKAIALETTNEDAIALTAFSANGHQEGDVP
jgi:hypothetical protein